MVPFTNPVTYVVRDPCIPYARQGMVPPYLAHQQSTCCHSRWTF